MNYPQRRNKRAVFAAVALAFGALLLAPSSSRAAQDDYDFQTPTEQYLAVRRMYPPKVGLTMEVLAQDPAKHRGMTMELEGRLSGIVRSGEEAAMLMLATDRYGSVSLTMSRLPHWVQSGERLRVLVVVTGGEEGAVEIGIPSMEVVAVASALDITGVEQDYQRRVAAREAARKRSASAASARAQLAKLSRGRLSSRSGGYSRGTSSSSGAYVAGLSPDAQSVYPAYRSFIQNHNRRLSDQEADDITRTLLIFSEKRDVDPRLVMAMFIAESDFDPGSTSHAGAMGIGQLMPETARSLGLSNPYDPVQNVAGSIWLLTSHLQKYSGGASGDALQMQHIRLALAAYNAGPGAVRKYKGIPPYRETQRYVKRVTELYKQLCAGDRGGVSS